MPLLVVLLIVWHGISRILVIYLTISTSYPTTPTQPEKLIGNLMVFNGLGFLLVVIAFFGPKTIQAGTPIRTQINFCILILLAVLSAAHDTMAGLSINHGVDHFFQDYINPVRSIWPALFYMIPSVLLFCALSCILFGGLALWKWRRK